MKSAKEGGVYMSPLPSDKRPARARKCKDFTMYSAVGERSVYPNMKNAFPTANATTEIMQK